MIKDFCTGKLIISLTENDIPCLKMFQEELFKASGNVITWGSGDNIDSKLTRSYIRSYDNRLLIYCENSKIYIADVRMHLGAPIIRLQELLEIRDYEIKESDVLNLLK